MKADFEGPPHDGDGSPSTDGWLAVLALLAAILVLVAIGLLVLPRA